MTTIHPLAHLAALPVGKNLPLGQAVYLQLVGVEDIAFLTSNFFQTFPSKWSASQNAILETFQNLKSSLTQIYRWRHLLRVTCLV